MGLILLGGMFLKMSLSPQTHAGKHHWQETNITHVKCHETVHQAANAAANKTRWQQPKQVKDTACGKQWMNE